MSKGNRNIELSTKLKYGIYTVLVAFCFSCTESGKDRQGRYLLMDKLLNECDCYGVVIATGKNNGYLEAYENFIVIKDRTGKTYTYQGTAYNVVKGDTLVRKTNCN